MYAIVRAGSKQQKVAVGDVIEIDKTDVAQGDSITLPVVMVVDGENVELKPDRYIWVEAASKRKILPGDEGLKLIAVGSPPGAYQPRQG